MADIISGYKISTYDSEGTLIDSSNEFSLDTSSFAPVTPSKDSDLNLTSTTVQTLTSLSIAIDLEGLPLDTGCYVKLTLPEELSSVTDNIKTLVDANSILSNSQEDNQEIEAVSNGLENNANLYAIFEGC